MIDLLSTKRFLFLFNILVVASGRINFNFSIPLSLLTKTSCPFPPINICGESTDTQIACQNLKYRIIDGRCNNPTSQTLGMAFTTYSRLLPPAYSDRIYKFRTARDGTALPSARLLSTKVFGRKRVIDSTWTWMNMQFGQFMAHDLTLRASNKFPGLKSIRESRQKCCSLQGRYNLETTSTPCEPISVPSNDSFFKGKECIHFDRTIADKDQQCQSSRENRSAEQINAVSHYLDLNTVYGNTNVEARKLREFKNGLLTTHEDKGKYPPRAIEKNELFCPSRKDETCYYLGDTRGNQNPGLVVLQVLFLREHNRLAEELKKINPIWNDETLYQEARRINIAQYQRIAYYEWGVEFYGKNRLQENKLIYNDVADDESIDDYNPCIDPRTLQEFAHAAFRYFHHQIFGLIKLYTETRKEDGPTLSLSQNIEKPGQIEEACKFQSYVRGMGTQQQKKTDFNIDEEVSENFRFGEANRGRDLKAYDIQRDRDHGLPSYNTFRQYCGIKRATQWNDFLDYIDQKDIDVLRSIYKHPDDVDLSVGGTLEKHPSKSLTGPTFLCLSLIQFYRSRVGDRYFFENGNQPNPFTKAQLTELRKATISRIMCDNSEVKNMQSNAFRLIKTDNSLKPCSQLPKVDITKWDMTLTTTIWPMSVEDSFE